MHLCFDGANDKCEEAFFSDCLHFYADILLNPRTNRAISIDIEITDEHDMCGTLFPLDNKVRTKDFMLIVKRAPLDEMLKTMAHEMVHVRQNAIGQLVTHVNVSKSLDGKVSHNVERVWEGKVWKPKRRESKYFDSPWEVEAFGREVGLFNRLNLHLEKQFGMKS